MPPLAAGALQCPPGELFQVAAQIPSRNNGSLSCTLLLSGRFTLSAMRNSFTRTRPRESSPTLSEASDPL